MTNAGLTCEGVKASASGGQLYADAPTRSALVARRFI